MYQANRQSGNLHVLLDIREAQIPLNLSACQPELAKMSEHQAFGDEKPAATQGLPEDVPTRPVQQNAAVATQVKDALAVLFAFRLINALCVRTFFQPDEYFQALEPAWQMAFGHESGAWLTWEWEHKLRSSLHPGVFALGYSMVFNYLATMPLSSSLRATVLVAIPKVIQAGFAALSDWYAWRLGEKLYGPNSAVAWSVLLMSIVNPWQWYCSTRTFSNSLEATLTIAALYHWPWELLGVSGGSKEKTPTPSPFQKPGAVNSLRMSLVLAGIAVLLRPTNSLIWLAIGTLMLTRFTLDGQSTLTPKTIFILVREGIFCGFCVLGLSLVADHQYFGEWTFPPYTWLHFNIAQSLAVFYGQNNWHYYLSQGIPLSCTTIAPFAIVGLWKATSLSSSKSIEMSNALKALALAVLTNISMLSLISHKEVRFIYPLLPILHILAAPYVTSFFTQVTEGGIPTASGAIGIKRKPYLAAGLLVNLFMAAYLSYFHGAAPIQVMGYLRGRFERIHPLNLAVSQKVNHTANPLELFALFLTPCHTTPWRSHLVYPALRARALTCEPPLHTEPGSPERANYVDEGYRFDANKVGFMSNDLWPASGDGEEIPRYIIGFEGIEDALQEYFGSSGPGADKGVTLKQTWSHWNGLFTDDDRKAGHLRVWSTGVYSENP
ncbi:GPI mannosyltransferase 3 [Pseudomassariella vexata]|uniref:Mannosyltransferase n=1 Tax=Pseudomassariella vexata TaxID=1141098 RepID=A0A1Y2EEJ1_9PEZI|nr:GPI mannosyltransferase 3 [Pseudomassariella vexata]ORY69998.1 GPI mannosyltransferase 3 [Pseudomassariella vexata]